MHNDIILYIYQFTTGNDTVNWLRANKCIYEQLQKQLKNASIVNYKLCNDRYHRYHWDQEYYKYIRIEMKTKISKTHIEIYNFKDKAFNVRDGLNNVTVKLRDLEIHCPLFFKLASSFLETAHRG